MASVFKTVGDELVGGFHPIPFPAIIILMVVLEPDLLRRLMGHFDPRRPIRQTGYVVEVPARRVEANDGRLRSRRTFIRQRDDQSDHC